MTDAQKIVVEEFEELGLFKLNTWNNFVQNVISVALRVTRDNADGFLEYFEWNSDLNQVLNNLQNYYF